MPNGVPGSMHERLAHILELVGFPHTIARTYVALLLAEGVGLTTGELIEQLQLSKASVSNATQFLVGTELVERYRVPGSREAHYRLLKDVWGPVLARKFAAMSAVRDTVVEALRTDLSPAARERLEEVHDVYTFFADEFEEVMTRFNERMRST